MPRRGLVQRLPRRCASREARLACALMDYALREPVESNNASIRTVAIDPQARAFERQQWVAEAVGGDDFRIEVASADASFRSYWRVIGSAGTRILMDAPPTHEDILPWLDINARLRAAGLNVPEVFASDAAQGFVLMQDLGNRTLLDALSESSVAGHYTDCMDALEKLQTGASVMGLAPYDTALLSREMHLMPEWFLHRHLDVAPDSGFSVAFDRAAAALIDSATEQPQVFVHRDFHSRNLLVTATNSPGIIDFQDAVCGPITYDLASLLRDCYVAWPEAQVEAWVEQYRLRMLRAGLVQTDAKTFQRWFDAIGLQRHLKVLGIFCRLFYRDGKSQYLADLPRVWGYVSRVAEKYAEFTPLLTALRGAIDGRDLAQPRVAG